jgi:hypothetical protein
MRTDLRPVGRPTLIRNEAIIGMMDAYMAKTKINTKVVKTAVESAASM